MEDYNRLISAKVLDGYEAMLDTVPQPQMLGGKRMRKYVLPGSTEYDYPGTLSVGRMDGKAPATLGGDFWKEFGDGFPDGSLQGGAVWRDAEGKIHSTGQVMPKRKGRGRKVTAKSIGKALKPLAPVGKELGMTLAKEGIRAGIEGMAEGGRRKKGFLQSVGKVVAPVAKEVFKEVIVPEGKKAVKSYIRESLKPKSAPSEGGRRKRKGILHSIGKELSSAGKEVFRDVVVPEGKRALREYIRESLKPKSAPSEGGALIRDFPGEFHSSVYPPALASYAHSFPAGHDAYGRGRAKLPKSGAKRNSARGAIVAEVMKKHGLSLPEASKFVKEKGLY